ncbi:hypothetical protein BU24DRAFT_488229 [Aaosphaeria arxii CBS 175.79]|uniref:Protein kinase domain-containing protein n=1 Tax=Aaosphaeria arxii CBS 175.79 TaxID=1450172 RepID=A0A6A5YB28_9PLEO|nr:uncharacterized protein BU24DRAFT_488229 [Aaosphaeria arxii CBS 175.79]KAF2021901.1 hypothetical protein BU24DRAFT_488229 [Aaosphaeria arxii CBS 175.79]
MSLQTLPKRELLMVGMSAKTYRIGNIVRKECHVLVDDIGITEQNLEACKTEADVYFILGSHPLIAKSLSSGPSREHVELEFYPNGNLREYIRKNRASITETDLKHGNLVARLSDFNASGFDDQPDLGLKGKPAQGLESISHSLPRDPEADSTVESDLFALGSTLYELIAGQTPYEGQSHESIETLFRKGEFPSTEGLLLEEVIMGCWKQTFSSATDVLNSNKNIFGVKETKEIDEIGAI